VTKAIQQSVKFQASPKELFDIYIDSKKHSEATGAPARLSRKAGGSFTAHGGQLCGKNLLIIPDRMIVQAWRARQWNASDPDSILILRFSKAKGGGQVDMVHVNVPPYDHAGVTKGWPKYYWSPWKAYIAKRLRKE
jgi:activator of HSP90 ATPase